MKTIPAFPSPQEVDRFLVSQGILPLGKTRRAAEQAMRETGASSWDDFIRRLTEREAPAVKRP
jgi:hypothetical protein